MEEVTRRTVLATLAVVPVVARLDADALSEDEADVLALAARDLSDTKMGDIDEKTWRTRWEIDPKRYPTFDHGDEVLVVARSLEARGFVELHDTRVVLPDGTTVNAYYEATERGRTALAAHRASARTTS